jgi:hypothetical protein
MRAFIVITRIVSVIKIAVYANICKSDLAIKALTNAEFFTTQCAPTMNIFGGKKTLSI